MIDKTPLETCALEAALHPLGEVAVEIGIGNPWPSIAVLKPLQLQKLLSAVIRITFWNIHAIKKEEPIT